MPSDVILTHNSGISSSEFTLRSLVCCRQPDRFKQVHLNVHQDIVEVMWVFSKSEATLTYVYVIKQTPEYMENQALAAK